MIKDWKKDVFTIPNYLSLFRLVLIPIYIWIYLHAESTRDYVIAAVILGVSCLTDLLDGFIARKLNMISSLGKILDPVADKMTQFSLLLALMFKYTELQYLLGLFVIKEGFQFVAGVVLLRKRRILKGAHMAGKISTTVLFVSLFVMILFQDLPQNLVVAITCVDFILLMISFVQYVRIFMGKGDQIQDL